MNPKWDPPNPLQRMAAYAMSRRRLGVAWKSLYVMYANTVYQYGSINVCFPFFFIRKIHPKQYFFFFNLMQVESTQSMIRIVGLSATLPNYLDVNRFSISYFFLHFFVKHVIWFAYFHWPGCTIFKSKCWNGIVLFWFYLPSSSSRATIYWNKRAKFFQEECFDEHHMLQKGFSPPSNF